MSRAIEQLHRTGISATMASIICGVNPWESPYSLYQRLVGASPPKDETMAMWLGTQMEPIVARAFTRETGLKVKRPRRKIDPDFLCRTSEYGFPMIALLDGLVDDDGETCGFEAKTASVWMADQWGDEPPLHYWFQVQHQMACADLRRTYVAALVGQKLFTMSVARDDELINLITDRERVFWHEHLVPRIPPPVDGHTATSEAVRRQYRRAEPDTTVIIEDPEVERLCGVYLAHGEAIDHLKEEREGVANNLKTLLDANERAEVGPYRLTFKEKKGQSRIDAKLLRAELPEIAAKYTKEGEPSRPLLVTRRKDA